MLDYIIEYYITGGWAFGPRGWAFGPRATHDFKYFSQTISFDIPAIYDHARSTEMKLSVYTYL